MDKSRNTDRLGSCRGERMTSDDLVRLLSVRHSKDVFVPECKDGPTWGGAHLRLDAWAMARSWTKPRTWGYEVKVSRRDFLSDEKWQGYLRYCNEFYFVTPLGMVQPAEVPGDVGLLWASKNAARLYKKKKATYRSIEIPDSFWRYIIMCRAAIVKDNRAGHAYGTREYWQDWMKKKEMDWNFGHAVGKALGERINTEIVAVRKHNERLQAAMVQYDGLLKFLGTIGIDPSRHDYRLCSTLQNKMEAMRRIIPHGLRNSVANSISSLQRFCDQLDEAQAKIDGPLREGS